MSNITIRPAIKSDLPAYIDLVQRVSQACYVNREYGFTPELFTPEVYAKPPLKDYLAARLNPDPARHVWVAVGSGQLIGTIALTEAAGQCELFGFYVDVAHQKQGIGSRLWQTALTVVGDREVVLDTYAHSPTVAIYEHWGFIEDPSKPRTPSQWPGRPAQAKAEVIYLRRPANR